MKKIIFIIIVILMSSCQGQYTCPTYMDKNEIKTDSINCQKIKIEDYGIN